MVAHPVALPLLDDPGTNVISHREPAPRGDETSGSPSSAPHPVLDDTALSGFPDTIQALLVEAGTLSLGRDIPAVELATTLPVSAALETAWSVGQYNDKPVTDTPRVLVASSVSSLGDNLHPVAAVRRNDATVSSSESALAAAAVTGGAAAPPLTVHDSTPDVAATTTLSPDAPVAQRTIITHTAIPNPSLSELAEDISGVDVASRTTTEY